MSMATVKAAHVTIPDSTLPHIRHHGAVRGVTGSCHELNVGDAGILIDCGLFQGEETSADRSAHAERPEIEFPIDHIRALVLTHVHLDHVGRIPYLLAAGYRGPILCSEPSAQLLPLVLEDAVKIGFTRQPWMIERFLEILQQRIVALPYGRWHDIDLGRDNATLAIKLKPSGHVLGSAYVECRIRRDGPEQRVVFSGDLGAPHAPLLAAPKPPYTADVVVLESTYGDRDHGDRAGRRRQLQHTIERALANRGTVLVPAFSIGRTQELLYELEGIIFSESRRRKRPGELRWEDLEIIVDSPLASRFTAAYRAMKPWWDAEARRRVAQGRHPLDFEQLTTIDDHDDHLRAVDYLARTGRPTVVIAASGMCTGGRIVDYLKAMLGDPRHDVLFVGYQAPGTPGHAILEHGPRGGWVELDGQRFEIRAGIHRLDGYSAHAGQKDLVNFIRRMRHPPRQVRLVHGEDAAKRALKAKLEELGLGIEVVVP